MSFLDNQSCTATGPVPITTGRRWRVNAIMRLSEPLPTGGSESSIAAGRTVLPITNRDICNRCGRRSRPGWSPGPSANLKAFRHAWSRYEYLIPIARRFGKDARAGRCALVRQRILRCCPDRGLFYKAHAGPEPACSQTSMGCDTVQRRRVVTTSQESIAQGIPAPCLRRHSIVRKAVPSATSELILPTDNLRCLCP